MSTSTGARQPADPAAPSTSPSVSPSSASASRSGGPATAGSHADRAEHGLRELLVTLQIHPGEPLREADLMARLEVGRTPLREALNRLQGENLVVIHPRRGTFATEVNIADLALITDLRAEVEGLAAARASEWASADELALLQGLVATEADGAEPVAAMELDARVHRAVWAAAHNPFLEEVAARHHSLSTRIWYLFVDRLRGLADHVDEHRELVARIVDRDGDAARALARDHVRSFEAAVRDLL